MSKGIKALIIILIIIAVLAAVVIAGSIVAGNMAEELLSEELGSMIVSSGFGDGISYSEIEVNLLRGEIKLTDASFAESETGLDFQAEEFFIRISPTEAAGFITDSENAVLSKVSAGAKGLSLNSGFGLENIKTDELELTIEGLFGPELFQNNEAVINKAVISADDILDGVFQGEIGSSIKEGELQVSEMDDQLKELFEANFAEAGLEIPEDGSFTLSFALPADGLPELEIKN